MVQSWHKFILTVVMSLLILTISGGKIFAQNTGLQTNVVSDVWLRVGPGTEWRRLELMPVGMTIALDGRTENGIWVRGINQNGQIGWVATNYLALNTGAVVSLPVIFRDAPITIQRPAPGIILSATSTPIMSTTGGIPVTPSIGVNSGGDTASFVNATQVTNPYFPKSTINYLVRLSEDGATRYEEVVLPGFRTIEWGNESVQAIQYYVLHYEDSQLRTASIQYYAQDTVGNVYLLGTDVTHYVNGQTSDHDGTWLAGRNGATATIVMPASPQVGMVFYTPDHQGLPIVENAILSVTEIVETPIGRIANALSIQQTGTDGSVVTRIYASDIGEVSVEISSQIIHTIWINTSRDLHRTVPINLIDIETEAENIFQSASVGDRATVRFVTENIVRSWNQYLARDLDVLVPTAFQDTMTRDLEDLQTLSRGNDMRAVQQVANKITFAVADLYSFYNPVMPVDLLRIAILERQVSLDVESDDFNAASGTIAQLSAIWVRTRPDVIARSHIGLAGQFETTLISQITAISTEDTPLLTRTVTIGRELLSSIRQLF